MYQGSQHGMPGAPFVQMPGGLPGRPPPQQPGVFGAIGGPIQGQPQQGLIPGQPWTPWSGSVVGAGPGMMAPMGQQPQQMPSQALGSFATGQAQQTQPQQQQQMPLLPFQMGGGMAGVMNGGMGGFPVQQQQHQQPPQQAMAGAVGQQPYWQGAQAALQAGAAMMHAQAMSSAPQQASPQQATVKEPQPSSKPSKPVGDISSSSLNSQIQACGQNAQRILELVETYLPKMDISNLTTALYKLSRVSELDHATLAQDYRFTQLVQNVHTQLESKPRSFNAQALSHLASGFARLGPQYVPQGFAEAFCRSLKACNLYEFKAQELGSLVNAVGKVGWLPEEAVMKHIVRACASGSFDGFQPQDMVNTISGFSKIKTTRLDTDFIQRFTQSIVSKNFKGFTEQQLTALVGAFGRVGQNPGHDFLGRLIKACMSFPGGSLSTFDDTAWATLVQGFGRLGYKPGDSFMHAVLERINMRRFDGVAPSDFAAVIEGLGKMGRQPSKAILDIILSVMRSRGMATFAPRDLTAIFGAFAEWGQHPGDDIIAAFQQWQVMCPEPSFDTAGLSGCIEVIARLGLKPDPVFVDRFVKVSTSTGFAAFDSAALACALRALARLAFQPGAPFLDALIDRWMDIQRDDMTPASLAYTIKGLAELGYRPKPEFYKRFLSVCQDQGLDRFTPRDIACTARGLAQLGHSPGLDFLDSLTRAADRASGGWGADDIADFFWALSAFDRLRTGISKPVLKRLASVLEEHVDGRGSGSLREGRRGRSSDEDVAMARSSTPTEIRDCCSVLRRALLTLPHALPGPNDDALIRIRSVADFGVAKLNTQIGRPTVMPTLPLAREVSLTLRKMGLQVWEGASAVYGALPLDLMIVPIDPAAPPIAVESDPPSHFFTNAPGVLHGAAAFRRKLLGQAVDRGDLAAFIAVPFWTWAEAGGVEEARAGLLEGWLAAAGVNVARYRVGPTAGGALLANGVGGGGGVVVEPQTQQTATSQHQQQNSLQPQQQLGQQQGGQMGSQSQQQQQQQGGAQQTPQQQQQQAAMMDPQQYAAQVAMWQQQQADAWAAYTAQYGQAGYGQTGYGQTGYGQTAYDPAQYAAAQAAAGQYGAQGATTASPAQTQAMAGGQQQPQQQQYAAWAAQMQAAGQMAAVGSATHQPQQAGVAGASLNGPANTKRQKTGQW